MQANGCAGRGGARTAAAGGAGAERAARGWRRRSAGAAKARCRRDAEAGVARERVRAWRGGGVWVPGGGSVRERRRFDLERMKTNVTLTCGARERVK